jgi:translocation and assembly module TamB
MVVLRALGRLGATLALALVFLVAVAVGVLLHLDTGAGRAIAHRSAERLLATALPGDIQIGGLERLDLRGLRAGQVRVRDPEGFAVIDAQGLEVELTLVSTIRGLLGGRGIVIEIPSATVATARVSLATTPEGELRLARAFAPDEPSPSSSDKATPIVALQRVVIDHVEVVDLPVVGTAEVHGLVGALRAADEVTIEVYEASVASHPPGLPRILVGVSGHLWLGEEKLAAGAAIRGLAGTIPVSVEGRLFDDERLAARIDIGPAEGDDLGPWLRTLEDLDGRAFVSASVEGTLDEPRLVAEVFHLRPPAAPARLTLRADAATDPVATVLARMRFQNVDLGAVLPELPATRLSGRATARATSLGDPAGWLRLELDPSWVEGRRTPSAMVDARYEEGALSGRAHLSGRGDLDATFHLRDDRLRLSAELEAFELGALPLTMTLAGTATGEVRADLALTPFAVVEGQADLRAEGVRVEGFEARRLRLSGEASGTIPELRIEASVGGVGLGLSGERLDWARAEVVGQGGTLQVEGRAGGGRVEQLALSTAVDLSPLRLRDTAVTARARGLELKAQAPTIDLSDGVEVSALRLSGVGDDVEASFLQRGRRLRISIDAPRVDLAHLGRLLGLSAAFSGVDGLGGEAAIRGWLERTGTRHEGRVELTLAGARMGSLPDVEGHVEASLSGRELEALGRLGWGELGLLRFELAPLELAGLDPMNPAAWLGATGRADASLRIDLDEMETLARTTTLRDLLPLGEIGGTATLSARVEREASAQPPTVDLSLALESLKLSGPIEPPSQFLSRLNGEAPATAPLRIEDVDVWVQLVLDGKLDEAELEVRLTDARGDLFWLDADARVPYASLWRQRKIEDLERRLRHVELEAWAHTAPRRLADLPRGFGLDDIDGILRARAHFSGSFERPALGVEIEIDDLGGWGLAAPLEARLSGRWEGEGARAEARLDSQGVRILDARAELEASLPALIAGKRRFRADLHAEMCSVPLGLLGPLADAGVEGKVTGRVTLERWGSPEVALEARLEGEALSLGKTRFDDAIVKLAARDGHLALTGRLEQTGGGGARLEVRGPLPWTETMPSFDELDSANIEVRARGLRLASLEPFLDGILTELDGKLEADATLQLGDVPELRGSARIHDGRFQLASFGETFFDAHAEVHFESGGVVRLSEFRARSLDGRLEGEGEATLEGLDLARARAALRIQDDIPLVIEGQSFGTVRGRIELDARRRGPGYVVDLGVPDLFVDLARQLPEGVQALEPSERIRIGTLRRGRFFAIPLGPPEEPSAPGKATPILVRVALGDVEVRQGQTTRAYLGGGPRIEIGDQMRVEGSIVIKSGTLDVQGKRFTIERSVVTFTGRPPDNPDVMATAVWTAPDGTKVYADYVGPLKTGKVELRSDPPLSKNEIVALLLFGDPSGAVGGTGDGAAGQAVGMGAGIVAEGLNEAISDLTSLDLRARVTTDRPGGAATELELQLSRRISLAIAHVLGLGDPQLPDRNFAIIEWRFRANWSLEASVGDHGSTSIDLLWQHRY